MSISGIYMIQSKCKPERIYIGSSIDIKNRWRIHRYELRHKKHDNKKLQNHVNKYGINDLIFMILTGCDEVNLIKIEQYYIDSHKCYFNIRTRAESNLGFRHTEESKAKMRHPLPDITKKRMSESRKGRQGPMLGKHHSEESKLKSSLSHKGCKAWNKGLKGILHSWNKTPIFQFDIDNNLIREWECAMYAEQELAISRSNIGQALKGKRKTAGGYVWKYKKAA